MTPFQTFETLEDLSSLWGIVNGLYIVLIGQNHGKMSWLFKHTKELRHRGPLIQWYSHMVAHKNKLLEKPRCALYFTQFKFVVSSFKIVLAGESLASSED